MISLIGAMAKPFTCKGEIYEAVFRKQEQFLINAGVYGLAVGGSTGGGHGLSGKEVARLVRASLAEARGWAPAVAGIIVDSIRQVIERAKAPADLGPAALQITPVYCLFRPDDGHMLEHF